MSYTNYTPTYHKAINRLINCSLWEGDTQRTRNLIAKSLCELRRIHGRDRARLERNHMRQIGGMFPVKGVQA